MPRGLLVAVLVAGAAALPRPGASAENFRPGAVREIRVPEGVVGPRAREGGNYLVNAAQSHLVRALADHFGVQRTPVTAGGAPLSWAGVVALGREPAVASGLVSLREIDALHPDGYIVRSNGTTVAVAGKRPIGTYWGALAFLERLGLRAYPTDRMGWHWSGAALPEVPPFSIVSRPPFFDNRWGNHLSNGLYRSQYRDLGDPSQADTALAKDDPIYSDHTAAYLLPKPRHMAQHPEYYAEIAGKRLGPETIHHRLTLCLSNPEVRRITAERAVEWIGKQPERRFFRIEDGDAKRCQCAACVALDPLPNYYTDRHLSWVNHVARAVAARHPGAILTTGAYIETQTAPVSMRPERNVVVFYCPWYWLVRCADKGPWDARNVLEMEEMIGWLLAVDRRNLGRQNYSMGLDTDTAILKWQAKNDIVNLRGYNGDEPRGLYAFVMSKLCEDPFLDRGRLEEEYCAAVFGPAGKAMAKAVRTHLRAKRETRWLEYGGAPPAAAVAYYRDMTALFDAALAAAADDPRVRATILADWAVGWQETMIDALKPVLPAAALRPAVERWLRYSAALYAALPERHYLRLAWERDKAKKTAETEKRLAGWGFALKPAPGGADAPDDLAGRLVAAGSVVPQARETAAARILLPERRLDPEDLRLATAAPDGAGRTEVRIPLDGPDAPSLFRTDTTDDGAPVPAPRRETVVPFPGETRAGVAIDFPFTKLPWRRLPLSGKGVARVRSGMFLAGCAIPGPRNVEGLPCFDFHLWANTTMKLSFFIDAGVDENRPRDMLRKACADVTVQPGEQIVRIDIRNLRRGSWEWERYLGRLRGFEIVAHPIDNFHPHPAAADGRIVLFSVTARARSLEPVELPARGRAIWMSQYRPNHRFRIQELGGDLYDPPQRYGLVRPAFLRSEFPSGQTEAFRTSTADRILAPVYGVVADPRNAREAETFTECLERMCGVRLPVNPAGMTASPEQGNAIFVGERAALASGRVSRRELTELAGEGGFVLRARDGAVAVAGRTPGATARGISAYLESLGAQVFIPGVLEKFPDLKNGVLSETVFFDRPYLSAPATPSVRSPRLGDAAAVERMAEAIKEGARERRQPVRSALAPAEASALGAYVAAKLLWDPFADTSYLIEDFVRAAKD